MAVFLRPPKSDIPLALEQFCPTRLRSCQGPSETPWEVPEAYYSLCGAEQWPLGSANFRSTPDVASVGLPLLRRATEA